MPLVIAASIIGVIFGAVVVSIGFRLSFQMPCYTYSLFGSIGGFLGLRLGIYIPSSFVTPSTEFMNNFEYNQVYAWHLFIHRMLLTFAILGGGTIGLGVRCLPHGVDVPSDAPKSFSNKGLGLFGYQLHEPCYPSVCIIRIGVVLA